MSAILAAIVDNIYYRALISDQREQSGRKSGGNPARSVSHCDTSVESLKATTGNRSAMPACWVARGGLNEAHSLNARATRGSE